MNNASPITQKDGFKHLFSIGRVKVCDWGKNADRRLVVRFPRDSKVEKRTCEQALATEKENSKNIPNYLKVLGGLPDSELFPDSSAEDFFRIAYEFPSQFKPMHKLNNHSEQLWIMKPIVDILSCIYEQRGEEGDFLGKEAVFINDQEEAVRVGFWGLGELFREYEVGPWSGIDNPDKGADLHNLAVCFKKKIQELQLQHAAVYLDGTTCNDQSSLDTLIKEIKQTEEFHRSEDKIYLDFRKMKNLEKRKKDIPGLIKDFNQACKKKHPNPQHKFTNLEGMNYFCRCTCTPGNPSYQVEHMGDNERFDRKDLTGKHYVKHEGDKEGDKKPSDKNYSLATVRESVSKRAKEIRMLPEVAIQHLEKNKFNEEYIHFWETGKLFHFLLEKDDQDNIIKPIEKLQEKKKILEIAPGLRVNKKEVGSLVDVSLWDVMELDCDKKPEGNQLRIGKASLETEDFTVFSCKGKIYLAVKEDRLKADDDPKEVFFDKTGSIKVCSTNKKYAIRTTPDRKNTSKGEPIPPAARLEENVELEEITYKHQIAATISMENFEFVNDNICQIIGNAKNPSCQKIDDEAALKIFDKELDEGQRQVVAFALRADPICLIHGPPGTGKTKVIVEIIMQLIGRYGDAVRILVCSQTHTAVINAIKRVAEKKASIKIVRLVSSHLKKNAFGVDKQFEELFPGKQRNKNKMEPSVRELWKAWCSSARVTTWDKEVDNCEGQVYFPCIKDGETETHINPKEAFLRNANVYGATCIHCASGSYRGIFGNKGFDCIIMDEASKATPGESLVPLQFAKKAVLVGDHKQLPPYYDEELNEALREKQDEEGVDSKHRESLFESYIKNEERWGNCTTMLKNQRRMTKEIGDLISKFFYDGELKTPEDKIKRDEKEGPILESKRSLVFIDTSDQKERHSEKEKGFGGKSSINLCNANIVDETLSALEKLLKQSKKKREVAVISGYGGQVRLLNKRIDKKSFRHVAIKEASTVDSFQGHEAPIVIYDTVRSGGSISSFLRDKKRLNVAFSRAQKLLIIIGDKSFLSKPGKDGEMTPLGEIVKYLDKSKLCFKSLEEAARK